MIRIRPGAKAVTAPAFLVVPIVLALALSAVPASAQVPADPEEGEFTLHEVVRGETLSGLAERYLGSWAAWPEIYEMNRIRIEDPHWIYPRQTFAIPVPPPRVSVTAVGVAVPEAERVTEPTGLGYLARRELIRYRTFEAQGIPEVADADRTVFYEASGDDLGGPRVLIQPASAVTALPGAVFRAAGWLLPDRLDVEAIAEIRGFAGEAPGRATIHPYDELRIQFFNGANMPALGDELLVYRITRSIDAGDVAAPSGRVRVTQVLPGAVTARVVQEYDRMQIGHQVTGLRTFPLSPGVHPSETDVRVEAVLLGFQDQKQLHLPGDFAFIDRGRLDGLAVGDELVAETGGDEQWPDRRAARFQVVGVRDEVATVRIVSVESPGAVRPGLTMTLDRKMP